MLVSILVVDSATFLGDFLDRTLAVGSCLLVRCDGALATYGAFLALEGLLLRESVRREYCMDSAWVFCAELGPKFVYIALAALLLRFGNGLRFALHL